MKKKKLLNKKTGIFLLVLLTLAVMANFFSRHRDAREAEDMKTEAGISKDAIREQSYIKLGIEDFSIGENITVKSFVKYSDGSSTNKTADTDSAIPNTESFIFNEESAKAAVIQFQLAMQEIGMAAFTGNDFTVIEHVYCVDEASLDIAEAKFEKAKKKYAYKDGSGIICVDFSNVKAEVTDETQEEIPRVKIRLEYDCHITSDKMDRNTLRSVEKDKSGSKEAEFQWEDGRWKLFYSGDVL